MTDPLELSCRCGEVRGLVELDEVSLLSRYVCYCDDCQAFIRYLDKVEDVLDPCGGTEVVHVKPSRVTFTSGREHLQCIGLKERGAFRWYASCCNTPIGSTPRSIGFPFLSLITAFISDAVPDRAIGPLRGRLMLRFAYGDTGSFERDGVPVLRVVARIIRTMLVDRIRGRHRKTPFFDDRSGDPVCCPRILSDDERVGLYPATKGSV